MKDLQPSITFNLARGLSSLADQATARLAARAPMLTTPLKACADVIKQAIHENPEIPKHDITAVELARRAGVLPHRKRSGGGDVEYFRRKKTGDRRRRA